MIPFPYNLCCVSWHQYRVSDSMVEDEARTNPNITSFADVSRDLVAMEGHINHTMQNSLVEIREMIAGLAVGGAQQVVCAHELVATLERVRVQNNHFPNGDSDYEDDVIPAIQENPREETKKIEISTFNGNLSIEEFLDWLAECEKFFEYAEIAEARQVKIMVWRLKGSVVVWWDEQQESRVRQGKNRV